MEASNKNRLHNRAMWLSCQLDNYSVLLLLLVTVTPLHCGLDPNSVPGTTRSTSSMATMEPGLLRSHRGNRTTGHVEGGGSTRRTHHGNRRWVADGVTGRSGTSTPHAASDWERWERGGHRGGARGRGRGGRGKFSNTSVAFRRNNASDGGAAGSEEEHNEMEEEHEIEEVEPNDPETPEERENFWQEVRRKHDFQWLRSLCSRSLVGQDT